MAHRAGLPLRLVLSAAKSSHFELSISQVLRLTRVILVCLRWPCRLASGSWQWRRRSVYTRGMAIYHRNWVRSSIDSMPVCCSALGWYSVAYVVLPVYTTKNLSRICITNHMPKLSEYYVMSVVTKKSENEPRLNKLTETEQESIQRVQTSPWLKMPSGRKLIYLCKTAATLQWTEKWEYKYITRVSNYVTLRYCYGA